ncbi:MAG TPA: enoyl-CoA hydratase/isomerase family protein [Gemmatimonadales bacterium]|jgi:methylglutaconyl-CoA hydratase
MAALLDSRRDAGVLTLTLNRPDKRNALSAPLIETLHQALESADLDPEVRVVVITGAGKDFCAGADLEELLASADAAPEANEAAALRLGGLFGRLRQLPKPVVAVVRGRAVAGGAGLMTACDIVLAGAGAQIGYPEIQRGFVPAMVMTMLRRLMGEKAALDLVLTGRLLSAEEALARGLVSRVVADDALDREARDLVSSLAAASPSALALTKRLFHQLDDQSYEQGIALGARVNALARQTPDFRAAISRFLAKT